MLQVLGLDFAIFGLEGVRECFAVPIMSRAAGTLFAVPVGFFPEEVLSGGSEAASGDFVGPSTVVTVSLVFEEEDGTESQTGLEAEVLLVDLHKMVMDFVGGARDSGFLYRQPRLGPRWKLPHEGGLLVVGVSYRGESPILLCRGAPAANGDSQAIPAEEQGSSWWGFPAEKSDYRNVGRATSRTFQEHPCYIVPIGDYGTAARPDGEPARIPCGSGPTSGSSAPAPFPDGGSRKSLSPAIHERGRHSPQSPDFPGEGHQDSPRPRGSRDSRRRATRPSIRSRLRGCNCSYWQQSAHGCDLGHFPTVPSSLNPGGTLGKPGWAGRFCWNWQLLSHLPEGVSQERQAHDGPGYEERRLLPEGVSECLPSLETHREDAEDLGGVCRQTDLCEVCGEEWWVLWPERFRVDDVATMPDWRCHDQWRQQRSTGVAGSNLGDDRAGCPRQWQVGGCMDPIASGGSPSGPLHGKASLDKSEAQGFLSTMPSRVGSNCVVLCQGGGYHQHPTSGGPPIEEDSEARGGGRQSQEEATEVSEEAKTRRGVDLELDEGLEHGSISSSSAPFWAEDSYDMHHDAYHYIPCSGSEDFCRDDGTFADDAGPFEEEPASEPPPTSRQWERLQTFSFSRWASSLCSEVLRSKTSFGIFLRSTLTVQRLLPSTSSSALFPLPVPKLGIFLPRRCGSRQRRRLMVDRAFHVCIMALNFWHADFKHIPVESIAKEPSPAQAQALVNLKRMLRAFGSSQEEFSVPKSGRRLTSLIALLSDPSEFATWRGIGGSAYSRSFPGAPDIGKKETYVPRNLSRAEELRPYRALDPDRLVLSGKAFWNPDRFLSDMLWMAFQEPNSLLWTASERSSMVPDLARESYDSVRDLALLWDINGLLHLEEAREDDDPTLAMRFFNCYKNETTDRMIGDRRSRNYVEGRLAGVSSGLPSAQCLFDLEIELPVQRISICASDRKDFYHQLGVPTTRARTNRLYPPLRISDLKSTKAFQAWALRRLGGNHYDRALEGDFLAFGGKKLKKAAEGGLINACFASIPQGDHLGVEFATDSHRNFLYHRGLLTTETELRADCPFYGSNLATGLVIDDYYAVSIEENSCPIWNPDQTWTGRSQAAQLLQKATTAYEEAGLLGSPAKDILDEQKACIMGAEIDGSQAARENGVVTVGAPVHKRLALAYVSLTLAKMRYTTDALHVCLVGGWVNAVLYRRPAMSLLQEVYKIPLSEVSQDSPKVIRLSRGMAQELIMLAVLCPFLATDISTHVQEQCYATDSSDAKGAVVSCKVPRNIARALVRTGRKKTTYTKMLAKHEAVLKKIDIDFEEADIPNDEFADDSFTAPDRPRAFRFHFIEVCGGSGKITKYVDELGWVVGPVLDLDRSPAYDFSVLRLLQWIYFMLEDGRLDSFMVEPPCTTCSPAQHPASRSYQEPRGYDPTDPKTLRGTTLALRSLALLQLAADLNTPGLLEQPRRSKMRRLSEWQTLVLLGRAEETWTASCMWGSPHQKEFIFLTVHMEASVLHRKCDKSHSHIRIEGKWTKPSATYTNPLAYGIATCFDKALRTKLKRLQLQEPKTLGLEGLLCNEVILSRKWQVDKVWRWKKPLHINIQEALAAERLFLQEAKLRPRSRFAIIMDSNVALSSLVKGRSPSHGLRKV